MNRTERVKKKMVREEEILFLISFKISVKLKCTRFLSAPYLHTIFLGVSIFLL
jgi:hypothetical protein